ncbi:MAG: hypothetical protein WC436_05405 [Candidatus Babeliales bacterium]
MNRFLEFKSKFKILAGLSILVFCVSFVGVRSASLPAAATDATIYTTNQTFGAGEDVGITNNGIAWLLGGFTMPNSGIVTFKTPVPVGDSILLDTTGIATLASDMHLADGARIGASGNIDAHRFSLVLTGSFSLGGSTVTFVNNNASIVGDGNVLDFDGGVLAISNNLTLTLSNIVLRNFTTGSITWGNASSQLYLENVLIELSGNFSVAGILNTYGTNVVTGVGQDLILAAGSIVTVESGSILSFDHGTTLDINVDSFHNNGILHFNGCTVDIAGAGLNLNDAGTLLFENRVVITGGETLENSAGTTKVLSGATVELKSGATLNIG